MKKVSVMVVAALLSASMFANSASLPKKPTTVKGTKPTTEMSKHHNQKDKQKTGTKEKKATKHASSKATTKK